MQNKAKFLKYFQRYSFILLGSFITAVGLELFLIPNNIIDGGIIGISIIASYLTKIPLGIFILALNLPFLFFGYREIGKNFVLSSLFGISCLAMWVSIINAMDLKPWTDEALLASVFGGIIIGIGVGIIIRNGGSLDGTEVVAIVVNEKTIFSVGQTVLFFNLFILSSAGLVFGSNRAMYSLIAYFIAFKLIDITIEGLDEAKAAIIISDKGEALAEAINLKLGRGVTFIEGTGAYSRDKKLVIYSVITRLEISKLKNIIDEIDSEAFLTINDVSDVKGGKYKKRQIH